MNTRGWIAPALLVLALCAATARPAAAQLNWTIVGVGEVDTEEVVLALASVSASPGGSGWSPIGGVHVSWLKYPISSTDDRQIISIVPSVGVRNGFDGGSFQFRVGYAFRESNDDDEDVAVGVPPVAADIRDDGLVNAAQVDYWGNGNLNAQLIGSYNYGSEFLWSRARLTQKIFDLSGSGHVRAGGEAAYLNGEDYDAWQVGGVVGFHAGGGTIINAGVGRKLAIGEGNDATYFRAEIVLNPGN
ncbi:MAG TPA: hypothetical protein VGC44_00510 [Longimicrobiales bacterium]